ncbi:MAG: hypothetical protein GXY07_09250 [Candidatus Hydrogenedentes bacterium]|nr:hypothetical protein [Candidatus Hydrogenedentota bacterium]
MIPRIQASRTAWVLFCCLCTALVSIAGATGSGPQADPEAVSALIHTMNGPEAQEAPLVYSDEGGFIRFLGAPPQARFIAPPVSGKSLPDAGQVALEFMSYHGKAFGLDANTMELRLRRTVAQGNLSFARLDQYLLDSDQAYQIYGAQVVVQLDETLNVLNVNADILRDTRELEKSFDSLTPVLSATLAVERAIAQNAAISGVDAALYTAVEEPVLVIFAPEVFSMAGVACLAWKVNLGVDAPNVQRMTSLINAQSGELLLRHADQPAARRREIYDTKGTEDLVNAELVRREGDPPVGNENIDTAYDYFGDCYNFYMNQHGRDSYDNQGSPIRAYVNHPMQNAYWDLGLHIMVIGDLFLSDDVVAHEFTHGVTEFDSDLIYYSYAGAITEMYSDLGGEFVDLTNGRGNDSPEVRWYLGEDMPSLIQDERGLDEDEEEDDDTRVNASDAPPGAIRYMKDPTMLLGGWRSPDRLTSPYLWDPFSLLDLGGLHFNCGIGNKLIYLLTDGDTFNGQNVFGMGIPKVADLFYAARPMLSGSADYFDLYYALRAASVALNYSSAERANIIAGARAVEIEPPDADGASILGLRNFRALPTLTTIGKPVVGLKWQNPSFATTMSIPVQITLYRSVTDFPTGPLDGMLLPVDSSESAYLDQDVRAGVTYYYTLIAQVGTLYSQRLHAKALAGNYGMNVYTEVFGDDLYTGSNPFDLSFSQLSFRPVMAPPPGGDDPYLSSMDFSDYEVTYTPGVYDLPVQRNEGGGAYNLTYTDDGIFPVMLGDRAFPFFGVPYSEIFLSSNGYVVFADIETLYTGADLIATLDMPTLAAHFALPRISFMFTDLAPHIGGEVWAKIMDDRFVVTLDNVAIKPGAYEYVLNPDRVTAQMELFYSGHIRITYLGAGLSTGIIGLSDGRGVPEEPSTVYGGILDGFHWVDFSGLADTPFRMSLNPVNTQIVSGGEAMSFNITAELPPGTTGAPAFVAEWDGPGAVPFADNGDGTGTFSWQTAYEDAGAYTVRIIAEFEGHYVFQDIRLVVNRGYNVKPTARNLRLSTNLTGEDPTTNRSVPVGTPLNAAFEYYHPYASEVPLLYGPGPSTVYWFRNGQVVSAFTNAMGVPSNIVRADDVWYFMVVPLSIGGIKGDPVISPIISVLGVPIVEEVFPNQGLTIGGDRITIRGKGLSAVTAVTFGGVPGSGIQISSGTELSVVTPIHPAGTVTVAVETVGGIGRKVDAFTFVGDVDDPEGDKARSFLGCGPRDSSPVSVLYDFLPAAAVLLLLAAGSMVRRLRMN